MSMDVMASKILVTLACLLALAQVDGLQVNSEGKIKVTVVTTAGCGDTVRFIPDLVEAYRLYSDFLDIEFIPWGKSEWDGVGEITCQFYANDCWANRLHRCVLNMLRGNQAAQMRYMECEFTSPYPSYMLGSYQCAQNAGLSLINVDFCVVNNHDDLDREAQLAASGPMAVTGFVPTIVFNDSMDVDLHNTAQTRLVSMICFALAAVPETGVTNCSID